MELLQKPIPGTLKRHWRRRQYQRRNGEVIKNKKNVNVARIRGGSGRFWRIKAIPKLRWKIASPIKLLRKLKKAHVDMMINWAGNVGYLNTGNTIGGNEFLKLGKFLQLIPAMNLKKGWFMRFARL